MLTKHKEKEILCLQIILAQILNLLHLVSPIITLPITLPITHQKRNLQAKEEGHLLTVKLVKNRNLLKFNSQKLNKEDWKNSKKKSNKECVKTISSVPINSKEGKLFKLKRRMENHQALSTKRFKELKRSKDNQIRISLKF